jgi:hypothetical protein
VILPLMVGFIPEVKWYHMAIVYNVTLPVLVYLVAKQILSTRPTGYGSADVTDLNPALKEYQNILIPFGNDQIKISPLFISSVVVIVLLALSTLPFLYHAANTDLDWVYDDNGFHEVNALNIEETKDAKFFFLDYRTAVASRPYDPELNPRSNGPYGMLAVLFSLCIPLGLGIGIGMYYSSRSKNLMRIREETKKLEQEFASALFQLGNRLADGLPTEIAFSKVAEVLEGTPTATFFESVTVNITKLGMSVEEAIFDPKQGAILQYPSPIIESSMKVLVESSKKGPLVASSAVINVSEYIKQMHRVDERLKDLLGEVISSMKSQINFLTPVIAGIVVGITTMMTSILGKISQGLLDVGSAGGQDAGRLTSIIGEGSIPSYHFQAIIGLYVVQISFILTLMVNGVENGADGTAEDDMLGKNLTRAALLYVIISAATIIIFGVIAGRIVGVNG